MEIVVLLKQVPDTQTIIKIGDNDKSIDISNIEWIINPYDEYAVAAALRLKKDIQDTNVTIVSLGTERTVKAIRTALAMGADKGILVDDPATEGSDALGKARVLAAALKQITFDLVFCGHRAVDDDENQVGIMVAELLGIPHLGLAVAVDMANDRIEIERPIEGAKVKLSSQLPALVTLGGAHAVWNPKLPTVPGIMQARNKPLEVKNLADLGLLPEQAGAAAAKIMVTSLEMPVPRQTGLMISGDTAAKARELARLLHETDKII